MLDRPKPTVGCSANERIIIIIINVEVGQTNDDVAGVENITIREAVHFFCALKFSTMKWAECVIDVM